MNGASALYVSIIEIDLGRQGLAFYTPGERWHFLEGHIEEENRRGFTFRRTEGKTLKIWEFTEVTYENFKNEFYRKTCSSASTTRRSFWTSTTNSSRITTAGRGTPPRAQTRRQTTDKRPSLERAAAFFMFVRLYCAARGGLSHAAWANAAYANFFRPATTLIFTPPSRAFDKFAPLPHNDLFVTPLHGVVSWGVFAERLFRG